MEMNKTGFMSIKIKIDPKKINEMVCDEGSACQSVKVMMHVEHASLRTQQFQTRYTRYALILTKCRREKQK